MTSQIDELMRMIHLYKYNGETYARVKAALEATLGQPQPVLKPGKSVTTVACSVCGEWQRWTPSGMVCKNGHGGAWS